MTSSDLPHLTALVARAERGSPRGAADVLAGARHDLPTPLPQRPRRSHRALAVAAAAVLVVAIFGAASLVRRDRAATPAGADATWCASLATPAVDAATIEGDLAVYVEPGATVDDDLLAMAGRLRADPRVEGVRVLDQRAAYDRFLVLFEGEDAILENVEPSDLPPWVEVDLIDPAQTDVVVDELRDDDGVFEVRPQLADVRVLDLLVWPGMNEAVWAAPDTTDRLGVYGPGWGAMVADVEASTPAEVAPAVETLVARLASPPAEVVAPDDPSPRGPSFEEAAAAATALREAAASRCGLEVAPRFAVRHETATTDASSGD